MGNRSGRSDTRAPDYKWPSHPPACTMTWRSNCFASRSCATELPNLRLSREPEHIHRSRFQAIHDELFSMAKCGVRIWPPSCQTWEETRGPSADGFGDDKNLMDKKSASDAA